MGTLDRLRSAAGERSLTLLAAAEIAPDLDDIPPAGARSLRDFAAGVSALLGLGLSPLGATLVVIALMLLALSLTPFAMAAAMRISLD